MSYPNLTDDERARRREYARTEAYQAGADDDTIDAIVDAAMGAEHLDADDFEECVEHCIQGHLMP